MSRARLVRGLFVSLSSLLFALVSNPGFAHQSAASSPQGAALLQKALAALVPSTTINDVTLTGTARRIAGSDDESGTVVVKALAGTGSRIDLTLPSGPRSEVRNTSSDPIAGSWSGTDGVWHATAYHNLLPDSALFPAFTLSALLSAQNAVISYVGSETHNGQSVIHVSASQQLPSLTGEPATLIQHLTQIDIFLDPNTYLPASIAFSMHPDRNELLDIPVEIRFSNYTPVNGAHVPFHVQKFVNNSLFLDLQFDSATLNSGLSSSTFAVGGAQ